MWVEVYSPFKKKWEIVNLSDASFAQNGLQFLSDHKNNNTGEKGRKKSAKSSTEVCPFVLAFDGRMVVDVSPRYIVIHRHIVIDVSPTSGTILNGQRCSTLAKNLKKYFQKQ